MTAFVELQTLLKQKNDDGSFVIDNETAQDVLVTLVFEMKKLGGKVPASPLIDRAFQAFVVRAQMDQATPDELPKRLQAYLEAHPAPAALQVALAAGLRAQRVGDALAATDGLASAFGDVASRAMSTEEAAAARRTGGASQLAARFPKK